MALEKEKEICESLGHQFKFWKYNIISMGIKTYADKPYSPQLEDIQKLTICFVCHNCLKQEFWDLNITEFMNDLVVNKYSKPFDRWAESMDWEQFKKEHNVGKK